MLATAARTTYAIFVIFGMWHLWANTQNGFSHFFNFRIWGVRRVEKGSILGPIFGVAWRPQFLADLRDFWFVASLDEILQDSFLNFPICPF